MSTKRRYFIPQILLLGLAVLVVGNACTPRFEVAELLSEQSGLSSQDPARVKDPASDATKIFSCTQPNSRGASEPGVRRLLIPQIVNTMKDLFVGTSALQVHQSAFASLPNDAVNTQIVDVGTEFSTPHSIPLIDLMYNFANTLANNSNDRQRIAGTCAATFPLNDVCATSFLNSFGSLILRRPLLAADTSIYLTQFKADGSNQEAFTNLLSRLLMSPEFLHLVQYGEPSQTHPGRTKLTVWEVASRLSYRIIGSMPDALLRAAAANGSLQDLAVVEAQVKRLLKTPRGRENILKIFSQSLGLANMQQPYSFHAAQLGINDTAAFRQELADEMLDYLQYMILDSHSTFNDLMTSKVAFPRSAAMQKIYGTASLWTGIGSPPVASNGQLGLAMRAAVLTENRKATSPITRGVFVRRKLLCEVLPSPDSNSVTEQEIAVGVLDPLVYSGREIVSRKTDSPKCMGCHSRINPTGFALEGFDPVGRPRTTEIVYNASHEQIGSHPVNDQVDNLMFESGKTLPSRSPADFAGGLQTSPAAMACFGQQIFRFSRLQVEQEADSCLLSDLENGIRSGDSLQNILIKSFANSDIFYRK